MRSVPYQTDPPQYSDSHAAISRLRRLAELENNQFDLSVELADLDAEIASRVERARVVLRLLRHTHAEIAALTVDAGGDA